MDVTEDERWTKPARSYRGSGMAIGAAPGLQVGLPLFDEPAPGLAPGGAVGRGIGNMIAHRRT